ncbi:MAG: hypothetical protein QOG87_2163 [Actinomycetota bacterium]|jgi:hypothetical protein
MRRTIEGFSARLLKIDELLVSADPLARLHLTQERIDLHAELVRVTNGQDPDLSAIEKEFVRVARLYGELAGITFAAWRQVGVDAEVLDQAGIVRTGTPRPDASRVRRTAEAAAEPAAEPLLPRTEPVAPVAEPVAPVPEPEPAPELVLELSEDPPLVPAEASAPAVQMPPPPPRPPRPKGPKPQKRPAPQAKDAAPAGAPASDADGEAPKLRRKRIAD